MQRVVDSGRACRSAESANRCRSWCLASSRVLAALPGHSSRRSLLPAVVTEGYQSLAIGRRRLGRGPFAVRCVAVSAQLRGGGAVAALVSWVCGGLRCRAIGAGRRAPASRLSRGLVHDGLAWFLLNSPLSALAFAGTLALLYLVLDRYLPFVRIDPELTGRLPTWVLVVAAVVLGDLMKWVHHNFMHKVPLLWHFHSVHHSQRELNLFTQARFHAIEFVTLAPIMYLPLVVLNLDFELAVWIVLGIEWYSRITHANLRTHFGPLRFALVTPQSHRVHHSREHRHHDQNFGTLFSFWDRLFGTQWPDHEEYPATGIADENFPWEKSVGGTSVLSNYFAQLIYPFQQVVKSWRSR